MTVQIAPLDPTDQASVDAVLALLTAAQLVEVPDFPPPCPDEFQGALTHPVSHKRYERYLAYQGSRLVGRLELMLPLRDNLDNAECELTVAVDHRRHGVGRALYAYALDRLRELGRKRLTTMAVRSLPGGVSRDEAGPAFATAMGGKPALEEVRRRLDLTTVDETDLAAFQAAARAKAIGYRLVTWRDRTPDEYVADAAYLNGRLLSDAPLGELAWEPEQIDVERLRESESAHAAMRFRMFSAGAVHEASGRMVAVTTIGGQHSTPWHAWQWITLVDPEHRGHRLGALVKLANLRLVRSHQPELRVIDTWNSADNAHMISINERMGFRPVDSWVNWQRDVTGGVSGSHGYHDQL